MAQPRETSQCLQHLRAMNLRSWGFTIYRTVYTAASNDIWTTFISTLDAYIRAEIEFELYQDTLYRKDPSDPPLDPGPAQELWSMYKSEVISDPKTLDGASIAKIREIHQEALRSNTAELVPPPQRVACLLVNPEVLESVLSAPMPPEQGLSPAQMESVYVKVVDVTYEPGEDAVPHPRMPTPPYDGWMKASIMCLWRLWTLLEDREVADFAPPVMAGVKETFMG